MNDSDIRRQRLKEMVARMGLTATAKSLGKPARQINDMIAERKSFGARVARDMEKTAGLAKFYFDTPESAEPPAKSTKPEEDSWGDEFKRQLNFFYDGMSLSHREAMVNMANTLYSIDNPGDRKADPWSGVERRKAQVLPLGELIEIAEEQDADNHQNHRISKQGTDKTSGRVVTTSKRR